MRDSIQSFLPDEEKGEEMRIYQQTKSVIKPFEAKFSSYLNMLKSRLSFKEEVMTCSYVTEREVTLLL